MKCEVIIEKNVPLVNPHPPPLNYGVLNDEYLWKYRIQEMSLLKIAPLIYIKDALITSL